MKGTRESKAPPPADLLVCFPSRAHLTLMPKSICSPGRPNSEPHKRHPRLKKINTTRSHAGGGGLPSPLLWAKRNQVTESQDLAEPTSPKVTCAGQIKVRPTAGNCRNWQSVMEEIERMHNSRAKRKSKTKKTKYWGEAWGFKKDIVNFLTCLGNIRFDFRCFGTFPAHDMSSDEEEEEEDEEEEEEEDEDNQRCSRETTAAAGEMETKLGDQHNNTVFSKWFMVLQDNNQEMKNTDKNWNIDQNKKDDPEEEVDDQVQVPPPNALLLMRCRSAPAKRSNWSRVQDSQHVTDASAKEHRRISSQEQTDDEDRKGTKGNEEEKKKAELAAGLEVVGLQDRLAEEINSQEKPKKKKKRESLAIVMKYDADFYLSTEICQETWLVGDLQDALSRSRSCKR